MKLVIASGIYPPDIGGPATYSQLIAKEFSKRRYKVAVVCYSDKQQTTNNKQQTFLVKRILRKHPKPIRYWLYFWNLLRIAKNADVIYAQGPLAAGLPAMWANRILKKKFVIKIVGDYAWEQFQNKKLNIKNKKFIDIETFQKNKYDFLTELRKKIQTNVVKSANKIIVPSEFLKKIVKAWGIDDKKIEVIYNAVSIRRYTQIESRQVGNTQKHAEKIQRKSAYPGGQNQRVSADIIITAGRAEPWKGFDTLKQIMPELKKENSKFKLIIATKLSHSELMEYFRRAKMFVLNSGYEGFSHIILEAMAMGLPVIASNVCGNPELIKDGESGLLIEYNNKEQIKKAILKLWKDKGLQKKFIANGKKTLQKFKLETMIDKTLEVFQS